MSQPQTWGKSDQTRGALLAVTSIGDRAFQKTFLLRIDNQDGLPAREETLDEGANMRGMGVAMGRAAPARKTRGTWRRHPSVSTAAQMRGRHKTVWTSRAVAMSAGQSVTFTRRASVTAVGH